MALKNPTLESIKQAINGLNIDNSKNIKLGGALTEDTSIDGNYLIDIKSTLLDYGVGTNYEVGFKIGEDVDGGEIGTSLYSLNTVTSARAEFAVSTNDTVAYSITSNGGETSYNRIINSPSQLTLITQEGVGQFKAFTIAVGGDTAYSDINGTGIKYVLPNYNNLTDDSLIPKIYVDNLVTSEALQDKVFAILTDTATIDLTYNDAANQVTADVINNSITNAKLAQMAANTVKVNNTNALANAVDLAIPTNTVLGRNDLGGNIEALPVQDILSSTGTLISGQHTVTDTRISTTSFVTSIAISSTGVITSVPIRWTASNGSMLFSTGQGTDTAMFSYTIYI